MDPHRAQAVQRSAVLEAALIEAVEDWLYQREGEEADDAAVREVSAQVQRVHPGLLLVPEVMEERYEAGEFPEGDRQQQIVRLVRRLGTVDAELPGLTQMLLDEYYAGELEGVRLELAWRLLDEHDRDVGRRLWP